MAPPRSTPAGRRVVTALCAGLAAAGAAVVGVRRWNDESSPVTAVVAASAPVTLLVFYPISAYAAATRRWGTAAAAAVLAGTHAVLTAPLGVPLLTRRGRTVVPGAQLRVLTANLLMTNAETELLAPQLTAERPDVVLLQEYSQTSATPLRASGALERYPYVFEHVSDTGGIALFSRFPVEALQQIDLVGRPAVSGVLHVPDAVPVHLLALRTHAPVRRETAKKWRQQLDGVRAWCAARPGPVIVAGDFNAVRTNRPFAQLLRGGGLLDAADATGRGWSATWPALRWVPPFTRPDHVLVTGIVPTASRVGHWFGSDHLPVVVDLLLPKT